MRSFLVWGFAGHLCLAISYGGRDDIVEACRDIAMGVANKEIDWNQIDEGILGKHTQTGRLGISDPDLIVRSSGESR